MIKGLHSDVYRIDDAVFKIKKWEKVDVKTARTSHAYNKKIREKFDFFPEYYGTVIAADEKDKSKLTVISFYEYVGPLTLASLKDIEEIFSIIAKAQTDGYYLDLKPSNFGKRNLIFYLDEYGVGKGLIPPDVIENIDRLKNKLLAWQKTLLTEHA